MHPNSIIIASLVLFLLPFQCATAKGDGQGAKNNSLPSETTANAAEATDLTAEELQKYPDLVEKGEMKIPAGRTFSFSELQEAHRLMGSNQQTGRSW